VPGGALSRGGCAQSDAWTEITSMKPKCFYRGYHLACISTQTDNGHYRARVAVMALDGERTRSQRFLDMETFGNEAEADERAIAGGKEWIDGQLHRERLDLPTNFAPLG
jgi:hypothetical protein